MKEEPNPIGPCAHCKGPLPGGTAILRGEIIMGLDAGLIRPFHRACAILVLGEKQCATPVAEMAIPDTVG